jgi:hypothetical protein
MPGAIAVVIFRLWEQKISEPPMEFAAAAH